MSRTLRFFLILALLVGAEVYTFIAVRFLTRSMPAGWRLGLTVGYVVVNILVWVGWFLFRRMEDWPHLWRNLYIAFCLGWTVAKLLVMLPMLIDDIRRLVIWAVAAAQHKQAAPAADEHGISRSQFLTRLALSIGGVALGGFLYGISNRYDYRIRRVRVRLAGLPAAFRGLKIVQLSDIHSGSFDDEDAVARGVEKAMAEKPDLILFTGDLVNNRATEIEPYKHIFARLKAPLGVYSTLGNHDYGDYVAWEPGPARDMNLAALRQHHADMGWRLLDNEHVILEKEGAELALLGIENWSAKAQFPKHGRLDLAYAGLSPDDGLVKILMSHDPSHWDAQVVPGEDKDGGIIPGYKDIALMLAGHTHGMQFGIEIPGLKWSPVKYMYQNWAGLYSKGDQHLYVNRGFGFLGYPGRLGILPEITVLELA